MQLHVGLSRESVMTWSTFQRMPSSEINIKSLKTWIHCSIFLMAIVTHDGDVCKCHFWFAGLGSKHLLLLTVGMTFLKLMLLCLGMFVCSFKLCQIFLLKCLTCEGFFESVFLADVLFEQKLSQRHLKACRRKRARYSKPAFAVWEDCLKTAVLGYFFPKEHWEQTGCRIRGKTVKNCIVLVLVIVSATWNCWS